MIWQVISSILAIIASVLTIDSFRKSKKIKYLKIEIKNTNQKYENIVQKVLISYSQSVPIIREKSRPASEILKQKFPKDYFYSDTYGSLFFATIFSLLFMNPNKIFFHHGISLIISSALLFYIPIILQRKIIGSLQGIDFVEVEILFKPDETLTKVKPK